MRKLLHQLSFGTGLFNLETKRPVNFTVKPSPTYRKLFEEVRDIQRNLQDLYLKLSEDLDSYSFEDDMYNFLSSIRSPREKKIKAFYLRSDYLLDKNSGECANTHRQYTYKQVEINTIAQCFAVFGPMVNSIHAQVDKRTVLSDADVKFIEYLTLLKEEYDSLHKRTGTVIAMVDNDTTTASSNFLEKMKIIAMCHERGVDVVHCKIGDILSEGNTIFYKDREIAIVYYRWFYNYSQYDEKAKEARKRIEASDAVSLPSAEFQMVNSKAFQRLLTDEKILRKYTPCPEKINKHFGEFKSPEDKIPSGWLLKDISEGGGHLNGQVKKSSFLMKKFDSPSFSNAFLLDGKERPLISELSFFGGLISVEGKVLYNEEGGYMVRSKDESSLEGGVCVGAGGLDSVYFLE